MKTNNEIIKLDVEILESFGNDDMLVIKGGGLKEVLVAIADIILGGFNGSCSNNCNCTNPECK